MHVYNNAQQLQLSVNVAEILGRGEVKFTSREHRVACFDIVRVPDKSLVPDTGRWSKLFVLTEAEDLC